MKKRYHILIVIGLFLCLFIIGSINCNDLTINSNLYSKGNMFGIILAAFGMMPGYACFAFIAGALITNTIKNEGLPKWAKIILHIVAVGFFGFAVAYAGGEIISVNSFNCPDKWYIGYPISFVVMAGMAVWGYFVGKKNSNPKLWIIILVMGVSALMALGPGVKLIKSIFNRPRYRYVVSSGMVEFHNWWEPCKNYKDYVGLSIGETLITKEEFKSFPSGHTGCAAVTLMFFSYLPLFLEKGKKQQVLFFYIGVAWTLLVAFSRMLIGAHYLTDISMGGMLTCVCFYIGNEILLKKGFFEENEIKENN